MKDDPELDNISRAFEIRFSFRSIYAVVDYANISGLHLDDAAGGGGVGGDRFGSADERGWAWAISANYITANPLRCVYLCERCSCKVLLENIS